MRHGEYGGFGAIAIRYLYPAHPDEMSRQYVTELDRIEVGTLSNRLPADLVVMNPEHRARAEEIWEIPEGTIPAQPGYHTMDMFRAFMRGDVKVMWIQTTNPWVSVPNVSRIQREPNDGRFVIVSDIYPTPTTEQADLVLRAAVNIPSTLEFAAVLDLLSADGLECVAPGVH